MMLCVLDLCFATPGGTSGTTGAGNAQHQRRTFNPSAKCLAPSGPILFLNRFSSRSDVFTCSERHDKSEMSTLEVGYRGANCSEDCTKLSNHLQSFRERRRALRSDAVDLQVDVLQRLVDLPWRTPQVRSEPFGGWLPGWQNMDSERTTPRTHLQHVCHVLGTLRANVVVAQVDVRDHLVRLPCRTTQTRNEHFGRWLPGSEGGVGRGWERTTSNTHLQHVCHGLNAFVLDSVVSKVDIRDRLVDLQLATPEVRN